MNEVERQMSFFDLPLAGRGFARDECLSSEHEAKIKNLNSMQQVRDAASADQQVRKQWTGSIRSV